jgi:hypothetical protein
VWDTAPSSLVLVVAHSVRLNPRVLALHLLEKKKQVMAFSHAKAANLRKFNCLDPKTHTPNTSSILHLRDKLRSFMVEGLFFWIQSLTF